jgi:hypothetical protein
MKLLRRRKDALVQLPPREKPRFTFTGRHPNGTHLIWRAENFAARAASVLHNNSAYMDGGVIIPAHKFWGSSK